MALTRERKVFLGILAAANGVLILDMGVLRGPAGASAAESGPIDALISGEDPAGMGSPLDGLRQDLQTGLGDALRAFADAEQLEASSTSEAFQWPEAWKVREVEQAESDSPVPVATTAMPEVTSVMPGGRGVGAAVIGGRTVRIGQVEPTLGARLVEVRPSGVVVLQRDGSRIELAIDAPIASASQTDRGP